MVNARYILVIPKFFSLFSTGYIVNKLIKNTLAQSENSG